MRKSHSRHISLCVWFPHGDPIANIIARLCILKEDLSIENEGIMSEKISNLDINSIGWRKIYFLRNIVRTLYEILDAVNDLRRDKEFESALSKQTTPVKEQFVEFFKMVDSQKQEIKKLRNNFWGGHVGKRAMDKALKQLLPDRKGLLEFETTFTTSKPMVGCNYKFAGDLILAHSVDNFSLKDQEQKLDELISTIARLNGASISMIDNIFALYATERRLLSWII